MFYQTYNLSPLDRVCISDGRSCCIYYLFSESRFPHVQNILQITTLSRNSTKRFCFYINNKLNQLLQILTITNLTGGRLFSSKLDTFECVSTHVFANFDSTGKINYSATDCIEINQWLTNILQLVCCYKFKS